MNTITGLLTTLASIVTIVGVTWAIFLGGGTTIRDLYRRQIEKKKTRPLHLPGKTRSRTVAVIVILLFAVLVLLCSNGLFVPGIDNADTSSTLSTCKHVRVQTGNWVTLPDKKLKIPSGCDLIFTSAVGHVNSLSWYNGALVAFPSGTYTISMTSGAYDIVPIDSGRAKYCNDIIQVHVLLKQPLAGWKPC